ncbi:hypothetical protein [Salipaludibacillus neizhouensis]|uniref:hypothetical protein n=1 Tax=Salipaludibacillus neizhouensis TaxID=885475 RepID=UPI0016045A98|nr:hypothetical protein [Salipaludibacillus neizhouensis]
MVQFTEKLNKVTEYINKMMDDQQAVGLSVAIVKDADIIYSIGVGNLCGLSMGIQG